MVLDLETTGLDPLRDAIIQIALRRSDGRTWASFVNPERAVDTAIRQLTGFMDVDFSQYPRFSDLVPEVREMLQGVRLVGHNIRFDLAFLHRYGIQADDPLDTLEWSRLAFPLRLHHSLSDWYADESDSLHDARRDTAMTENLLHRIRDQMVTFSPELKRDLARFLATEWSWWEVGIEGGTTRSPLYTPAPDLFEAEPLRPEDMAGQATEWLAGEGKLAAAVDGFEVRPGQLKMANAVDRALEDGQILMVEAGTGTGKSLAYLAPAVLRGLRHGERIVVATHTVALQEQLWFKDLPQARRDLPVTAALVKGRGRYLCLYKASEAVETSALLAETRERRWTLATLLSYIEATEIGDAEEFPLKHDVGRALWREVMADSHSCAGSRCPYAGPCFMRKARHRAESSHIVVVNHALLAAHIANGNILPEYSHLIVDEAHHLAEVLEKSLGFELDVEDWTRRYRDVMHPRLGLFERLPVHPELLGAVQAIKSRYQRLDTAVKELGESLVAVTAPGEYDRRSVRLTEDVFDLLAGQGALDRWQRLNQTMADLVDETDLLWQEAEARGASETAAWLRFRQWQQELTDQAVGMSLWGQLSSDRVSWWEVRTGHQGEPVVTWRWAPVDIAQIVEARLWSMLESAVLTSATMSVRGRFDYLAEGLGIPRDRLAELRVESPFDWRAQARLLIPTDSPDPKEPGYLDALARMVVEAARARSGRTLVLLTSYRAVEGLAWRIRDELAQDQVRVMAQNIDGPARRLVSEFRQNPRAVLMGTLTYWEGVDIPGDDLEVVVMGRLPFRAPGDPLEEAKLERIRQHGQSPFYRRSLPEAVLRFQQGFGRLIRTKTDRGVVIVFDPRVQPGRTRYAGIFLGSLAEVPRVVGSRDRLLETIDEFWRTSDAHSH